MEFKSVFCRYRTSNVSFGDNTNHKVELATDNIQNDLFDLVVAGTDAENVTIKLALKKDIAIEYLSVSFSIPKNGQVQALNRYYKTTPVTGTIWNNDFTPLYILYTSGNETFALLNYNRLFAHKCTDNGDYLLLEVILDAAALHPKWDYTGPDRLSTSSPLLPAGHSYKVSFRNIKISTPAHVPVISRHKAGAEATFMLTDHCDYDDAARLETFLKEPDGWLNKQLKISKGVFARNSTAKGGKRNDTLDIDKYRELIDLLYKDGSEIVPHALNQSGQISPEDYHSSLNRLQQNYNSQLWIDHGCTLKYCYSMGGKNNSDYRLVDNLQEKGYKGLWSFHDTPVNPNKTLNHFSNEKEHYYQVIPLFLRKLLRGQVFVGLHHLRALIERKNEGQKFISLTLKRISAFRILLVTIGRDKKTAIDKFRKNLKAAKQTSIQTYLPYTKEELVQLSSLLFTEVGIPLYQAAGNDLVMFSTQETTQLDEIYNAASLDRLVQQNGIHAGHTYILNNLSYINGVFKKGSKYELADYWKKFTSYLSDSIKSNKVWNPNMSEFITYYRQVNELDIIYNGNNSITINNNTSNNISGVTFCLAQHPANLSWNGQKPATKQSGTLTYLWGDIPAKSSVVINWQ